MKLKQEVVIGVSRARGWNILFLILPFWSGEGDKRDFWRIWNNSASLCIRHENLRHTELNKLMKGMLWYGCLWDLETRPGDPYCLFPCHSLKSDLLSWLSSTPHTCKNSGAPVHRPLRSHYLWCWSTRFLPHCISLLVYWIWTNVGNQRKIQLWQSCSQLFSAW